MVVPIANLTAVVTGAMAAAKEMLPAAVTRDAVVEATRALAAWFMRHLWAWFAVARTFAVENLPAAVTRDAVVEATRASAAWFMRHLWAWFAVARTFAVDNLPAGAAAAARNAAGSTAEASGPWVQSAAKLVHSLYGWVITTAVSKLPDIAADKLLGDAATWFTKSRGVAAYMTMALVLLAVAFLGGAICALTCRTMKAPGLGGARVPRAAFKANPKLYFATARRAKKVRRRGVCGTGCKLLSTGLLVAFLAYLVAKVVI